MWGSRYSSLFRDEVNRLSKIKPLVQGQTANQALNRNYATSLIFSEDVQITHGERTVFSTSGAGMTGSPHVRE